jgi:nitrogen regulatory protein PII
MIAFTIGLSSIGSVLSTICRQADENIKIGSEDMAITSKDPYHLIVTIVNSGYFEQVMEAAKNAGATGGTLVHARGLGSKEAMKYLGITIQPEKDLVLILTPREKKHAIMESIVHNVGLHTAGMGICFSLPADHVLGFGTGIDHKNEL